MVLPPVHPATPPAAVAAPPVDDAPAAAAAEGTAQQQSAPPSEEDLDSRAERMVGEINKHLPKDVKVFDIIRTTNTFDARKG
jgi:hypothetical protein